MKVNDRGPSGATWGPLDGLENIPAWAYTIGDEVMFMSPARSVQFSLVDIVGIVYSKAISASQAVLQLQPKLPSRSYFVRLYSKGEVKITRLIIRR